jgi:hypothetical protein
MRHRTPRAPSAGALEHLPAKFESIEFEDFLGESDLLEIGFPTSDCDDACSTARELQREQALQCAKIENTELLDGCVTHIRDDLHNLLKPHLASAEDAGVYRVEVVTEPDVVRCPGPVSLLDLSLPPRHFRSVHELTRLLVIASRKRRSVMLKTNPATG